MTDPVILQEEPSIRAREMAEQMLAEHGHHFNAEQRVLLRFVLTTTYLYGRLDGTNKFLEIAALQHLLKL